MSESNGVRREAGEALELIPIVFMLGGVGVHRPDLVGSAAVADDRGRFAGSGGLGFDGVGIDGGEQLPVVVEIVATGAR